MSTQLDNIEIFHIRRLCEKIMFRNLLPNHFYKEQKFLAKHILDLI
jgi:hypothetical protein